MRKAISSNPRCVIFYMVMKYFILLYNNETCTIWYTRGRSGIEKTGQFRLSLTIPFEFDFRSRHRRSVVTLQENLALRLKRTSFKLNVICKYDTDVTLDTQQFDVEPKASVSGRKEDVGNLYDGFMMSLSYGFHIIELFKQKSISFLSKMCSF